MLPPDELADLIASAVNAAFQPLVSRVRELEKHQPESARDGRDGVNGKDGSSGLDGKDGANGLNGRDGAGITDALLTKDGHLVLTFSDGTTRAVGKVMGEHGRDGANGLNGKDGQAGAIGPQGSQGEPGAAGPQGKAGDKGETGSAGERGPQGEPGASVTGPRGEQGESGQVGARGTEGPQGVAGKDGSAGLNGKDGTNGLNGKDAIFDYAAFNVIANRVASMETKVAAIPADVSPDELAQQFAGLLKKELDAIAPPVRLQKRIIRDAAGRLERVVEEPVA